MHNIVVIDNSTVLQTLNLLREQVLIILTTKKKW